MTKYASEGKEVEKGHKKGIETLVHISLSVLLSTEESFIKNAYCTRCKKFITSIVLERRFYDLPHPMSFRSFRREIFTLCKFDPGGQCKERLLA